MKKANNSHLFVLILCLNGIFSPYTKASEIKNGWVDLFGDGTFGLWQQHDGREVPVHTWNIKEGVVHFKDKNIFFSQAITTREKYKDFELKFDWKISEGGNSGIKYRIAPDDSRLGLEYQILDDMNHPDNKKASRRSSSLYDLVAAAEDKPLNPVGEWNTGKIVVKDNHIEHWLNNTKVLEIEYGSEDWHERFQKSKYKKKQGFGSWEGSILLQDHRDEFWIRNMYIRKI